MHSTESMPGSRVPLGGSERKSARDAYPDGPAVACLEGTWHVRSYAAVRQVLRDADATRQAGFNAELAARTGLRPPVLFEDGREHREHRTAIARFFTPSAVEERYHTLIESASEALVARLERAGRADLGQLSLELAMQVAAAVVGLTASRAPAMARRLEGILSLERLERLPPWRRPAEMLRVQFHVARFFFQDVMPAIRARRQRPREDVISHLLAKGYRNAEILIECITYGAAGMATTREFIAMAAWHLLEHDALRHEYLAGDGSERHRILHEILRLEPVVGRLYRRAVKDLDVEHDGTASLVPAGALIALDIRAANADAAAVGAEPLRVRPERARAPRVQESALSFGDGAHRCPGAFIAIAESDAFLTRLLRLPLRVAGAPRLAWNDLIEGYEVRGFEVVVGEGRDVAPAGAPPHRVA